MSALDLPLHLLVRAWIVRRLTKRVQRGISIASPEQIATSQAAAAMSTLAGVDLMSANTSMTRAYIVSSFADTITNYAREQLDTAETLSRLGVEAIFTVPKDGAI